MRSVRDRVMRLESVRALCIAFPHTSVSAPPPAHGTRTVGLFQTNLNKVQSFKNQFNRNKSINPEKHINPLSVVFHSETPTRFLGLSSKSGLVKIIIDKITTKINVLHSLSDNKDNKGNA